MAHVATINTPGYLPMDDEPPVFDTAVEAWSYLADERTREEDAAFEDGDDEAYSSVREALCVLGDSTTRGAEHAAELDMVGVASDGTGHLWGPTPGYDGDHDLGLVYSVSVSVAEDY